MWFIAVMQQRTESPSMRLLYHIIPKSSMGEGEKDSIKAALSFLHLFRPSLASRFLRFAELSGIGIQESGGAGAKT